MKQSRLSAITSQSPQVWIEQKVGRLFDYLVDLPKKPKGLFSTMGKKAKWLRLDQQPPANGGGDPDRPQEVDSAFNLMVPEHIRNAPVLIVSACTNDAKKIVQYLEGHAMEVCLTNAVDLALHAIADAPDHWGIMFVLMDDLEDEKSTIDYLRLFRAIQPTLPIVLVSKSFHGNDFGTVQAEICDVSLKLPVSKTTLVLAMSQANQNSRLLNDKG